MSVLFGIATAGDPSNPGGWLAEMSRAFDGWRVDPLEREAATDVAMGCRPAVTSARVRLSRGTLASDTLVLAFDGRIDNRREIAGRLGVAEIDTLSDAQLVLAAWRLAGENLPAHLLGDFAFAIYDRRNRSLALVRDHLGIRPLYMTSNGAAVAFASAIPGLLALPWIDRRWNSHWAVDYLEETKASASETAYRAIEAVPPATIVTFRDGRRSQKRFWSLPENARPTKIGNSEAIVHARALFEEAVRCRMSDIGPTACELSGGLDSSSIAAVADEQDGGARGVIGVTQSLARNAPSAYFERSDAHFAAAVYAARPGIERLDVTSTMPSLVDTLRAAVKRHGLPPRNDFNAISSEAPSLLAGRDVRVLLSGYGGDQLVTTSFSGFEESLLAEREWIMLAHRLLLGNERRKALRRALSHTGLPGWLVRPAMPPRRNQPPLASEEALAAHGYPDRGLLHQFPPWQGTLQQRDIAGLMRPVIAYRLQDSQVGAAAYGFDYRYPMLDVRLLEFVHGLPTRIRLGIGRPRRLISEMMRGSLPEEVRMRQDKQGLAVPPVFVNAVKFAGELRAFLLRARRDNAVLRDYARFDDILETLAYVEREREFPKETARRLGRRHYDGANARQVFRLTMLALWLDEGNVSPEPLRPDQPNQAV